MIFFIGYSGIYEVEREWGRPAFFVVGMWRSTEVANIKIITDVPDVFEEFIISIETYERLKKELLHAPLWGGQTDESV